MGKEILFFKTQQDLVKLLDFIESSFQIKYIRAGLLDERPRTVKSILGESTFGFVGHKDWNFNIRYLIVDENKEPIIREVRQKNGNIKYAIDQMKNEDSLVLSLGGFNMKEKAIIPSKISTKDFTPLTNLFLKKLNEYLKNNSKKVHGFYIGNHAIEMSRRGVRLTENTLLSRTHDIGI